MTTTPFREGDRLYTIYSTTDGSRDKWLVKIHTVLPNRLWEELISEFWTFDAAYHFVKAKQDEVI